MDFRDSMCIFLVVAVVEMFYLFVGIEKWRCECSC